MFLILTSSMHYDDVQGTSTLAGLQDCWMMQMYDPHQAFHSHSHSRLSPVARPPARLSVTEAVLI